MLRVALTILSLTLLGASSAWSAHLGVDVVITFNDGDHLAIAVADALVWTPVATDDDGDFALMLTDGDGARVATLWLSDLRHITYAPHAVDPAPSPTAGIDGLPAAPTAAARLAVGSRGITIDGAEPRTQVIVADTAGRVVATLLTDDDGHLDWDTNSVPAGVYIIAAGRFTFKIATR